MSATDDKLASLVSRLDALELDLMTFGPVKDADMVFQAGFRVGDAKALLKDVQARREGVGHDD